MNTKKIILMIFGSSGIRMKYGLDLKNIIKDVGYILGSENRCVVVGMDTRYSGYELKDIFIDSVINSGGEVYDAGIVPTPVVGFGARFYGVGAMVTASHNPEEYNGLKLLNSDGTAFSIEQQMLLEKKLMNKESGIQSIWKQKHTKKCVDILTPYQDSFSEKFGSIEGVEILVDCGNGAGCVVTPGLLKDLGAFVHRLHCIPSGKFRRPLEPIEANLQYLKNKIIESESMGAVVHDGDADRMVAFDNRGRYISGEKLMILFIQYLGVKNVVTTIDTSMILEDIVNVRRTPVGDSYVSNELKSWGDFGAEPSGVWIFPEQSLCPDGPYAAALFCEMLLDMNVAEEIDKIPEYHVIRESIDCDDTVKIMREIGADKPTDGIIISDDWGRCLIRASGTEPKIRVTAEGKDKQKSEQMLDRGKKMLKDVIK